MPIIGILLHTENEKVYAKEELFKAIISFGGIPIGFYLDSYVIDRIINLCDGFILPGGDDYTIDELLFLKKLYNLNKKVLGICLGMQTIGALFGGNLLKVSNHKSKNKYAHSININKDSLLYKIIGKDKIIVNSRHEYSIINPNLGISAISDDGKIEAIEDSNKVFFMGVQWHPESLYIFDNNARRIFKYFIKKCGGDNY